MPVGITEEHQDLAEATQRFFARAAPVAETRQRAEQLARGEVPSSWSDVVAQGLVSLHLPEEVGGGGGDLVDLAIAVEAGGRTLYPGPFLPTVLASAIVERTGDPAATDGVLRRFAGGATGAACLGVGSLRAEPDGAGGHRLTGAAEPVLGLPGADVLVVGARVASAGPPGGAEVWAVLETAGLEGLSVDAHPCVDITRAIGSATFDGVAVPPGAVLAGASEQAVRLLAAVLLAADSTGAVRWCLDTVLDYVKQRQAFGQVVGAFQAVKHRCAQVFIQSEKMAAAVWDGARSFAEPPGQQKLAAASTAVTCLEPAMDAALDALTLLGGIGFTWEHDVHLFWRRCILASQLLGPRAAWEREAGRAAAGEARNFAVEVSVPEEFRDRVRTMVAEVAALPLAEQRRRMADLGLVSPQYPPPYGLGAGAAEQLAIAEEMEKAGLRQPSLVIGEWAVPTIIAHGTEVQRERFVPPSLRGELVWCQLFSEPGAGSDLASLSTRATPTEGGWVLNGQKVWNSSAHVADWGICLARTDPDVPKHQGISYFLVDMHSPGLEVRPLRQSTGDAEFNEVFFTDVFVPDDCLVGDVNAGWRLAQTTLGNERVQMGGLLGFGVDPVAFFEKAGRSAADDADAELLGAVMAERICLAAMGTRSLLRRIAGQQPGAEASVLKLANSWHQVRVGKALMTWAGPTVAASTGGLGDEALHKYLFVPSVLIGGGTSEIQLNVIAERVLGLPRR